MNDLFADFPAQIILAIANVVILIIFLVITIINSSKIKKMKKRYNIFMEGLSDRNVEQLIDTCLNDLKGIKVKNKEIENHINQVERNLYQCIQKVGIVRYNAFENVGSDLSYSIALLDYYENGVVISSIFSRDSSTTYAKPIEEGNSKYPLSAEEIQAIDIAKRNNVERLYISSSNKI